MNREDRNLIKVILILWAIQFLVISVPLKTQLEIKIFLGLVPEIASFIYWAELIYEYGNTGLLFPFILAVILIKDFLIAQLLHRD